MPADGVESERPRIEWQDAKRISAGAVIVDDDGREFVVSGLRDDLGMVLIVAMDDDGAEHAFTDDAYRVLRMDA